MRIKIELVFATSSTMKELDLPCHPRNGDEVYINDEYDYPNGYYKVVKSTLCINKGLDPFYMVRSVYRGDMP